MGDAFLFTWDGDTGELEVQASDHETNFLMTGASVKIAVACMQGLSLKAVNILYFLDGVRQGSFQITEMGHEKSDQKPGQDTPTTP